METKATILVVEDDIHLLEGICDILELEGYGVLTAQNGKLALDILGQQEAPPDLIVSDIMMPLMDGIEFFHHVRQEPRWVGVPFIFLTARGEKADYHKGMRMGVDDYVIKPYDPTDLLVKIEARLKRQRLLNQAHSKSLANLKRQILTILNHEFRTPLTFVVAYADMLNDPSTGKLSENEIVTYLKGVSAGAERLRLLVENFILLVEIETGDAQQTYDWRKCAIGNLEPIFREGRSRVKALAEGVNPLEIRIEGDIPLFIGDPEYLAVAVAQLLSNAAKFSEPGKPIQLGARADDQRVSIWVKDEGRGIPTQELQQIWDSFYQIDRATYEDQGAGAGLAIVRGVIQLHGGQVEVASQPGMGSTFTLHIPVQPPIA